MNFNSKARRHRPPRVEYGVYFAVIFLISLPLALARSLWPAQADVAGVQTRRFGFIGRAWSEARTVTPMIFSA